MLKESLTERELDFLKLPVGRKCRDSDHFSMTTDDLLLLPSDGSLPVTRTSAFLSQSGCYRLGQHSIDSHTRPGVAPRNTFRHPTALRTPHRSRVSGQERPLRVDDLLLSSSTAGTHLPRSSHVTKRDPPGSLASCHLPRWITSHKSEMDFSGVTSIPSLRYPAWLRECDVPTETTSGAPSIPSWVQELGENSDEGQQDPKGNKATLRELRLQFAETLAAADSRESRSAPYDKGEPFRGLWVMCML